MKELGLAADRIEDICYGIAIHVDDEADFPGERTPLALSVGDADNIDRFDAYRIYEGLQRQDFGALPLEEKRAGAEKTLSRLAQLRDMPLATQTAKTLWQERIDFYTDFYRRLLAQADASAQIR